MSKQSAMISFWNLERVRGKGKMIKQLFWMALVVGLVGCATMDRMKTLKRFQETERSYRSLIQRSQFEPATGYVDPNWWTDHPPEIERLKNYRITNCDVEKAVISEDGTQVTQKVVIHYFKTDRMILKTTINHQKWQYNSDDRRWLLMNGLPHFK